MSILDDAIREHLELKRAHGADDAELKKLEDEAFGPPQRPDEPDPFAEAPTEFLVSPEVPAGEQADEPSSERRVPNIADLQEAPAQHPAPEASEDEDSDDGPSDEEHPAMEHEAITDTGPSTEERHAIAEQPTEMFDVEGQFEDAATESDAPSDDELVDAELAEPRLAPVDPLAGIEASAAAEAPAETAAEEDEPADEFDEFFSEQRLSDELNQALEAPLPDEPGAPATEEAPAVFVDADEEDAGSEVAFEDEPSDEHELATPEAPPEPDEEDEPAAPATGSSHEDVLEDTPEFLEDAPEDDNLWFEQKPPKDFDFDD
jgi:hypothetical protein